MDLYETYRIVIKKCLPNAIICADPFHVDYCWLFEPAIIRNLDNPLKGLSFLLEKGAVKKPRF